MRILNSILRLGKDGLSLEADRRHAEMLVKALDLQKCNGAATPEVKEEVDYGVELGDDMSPNQPLNTPSGMSPEQPQDSPPFTSVLAISRAGKPISFF